MEKYDEVNTTTKDHNVYIMDLVHHYFYIFHAWVAHKKFQKLILNVLRVTTGTTILIFLIVYFFNTCQIFVKLDSFYLFISIVLLIVSFCIQLFSLVLSFFLLSPLKIDVIQKRIFDELNISISLNHRASRKNYFVNKFDIEKVWVETVLGDKENIDYLLNTVSENMKYRRPTSRSFETVIGNTLRNPYITNSLVIIFTVSLTISLSPLIPTIDNDNFSSVLKALNITALNIWLLILIIFLIVKFIFMTFEWSFEYSSSRKQLVLWRYEIFLDMLARHQKVKTLKPKVRLS